MKITLDLPDSDLEQICEMTGIRKKSPAIRKVLEDVLRVRQRAVISEKSLRGEWSAEIEGYEAAKARDRDTIQTLTDLWRD